MKALGLEVSDKKIFENCILKTHFLTPWPTYATNWNNLNNFDRGPPRDHSCEVWSKSNERFQRRRCLSKNVFARRTTDDGQRPVTIAHPEHFVLRWAKKLTHSPTNALTDDGQKTVTKAHSEHFVLRWAKNLLFPGQWSFHQTVLPWFSHFLQYLECPSENTLQLCH